MGTNHSACAVDSWLGSPDGSGTLKHALHAAPNETGAAYPTTPCE